MAPSTVCHRIADTAQMVYNGFRPNHHPLDTMPPTTDMFNLTRKLVPTFVLTYWRYHVPQPTVSPRAKHGGVQNLGHTNLER